MKRDTWIGLAAGAAALVVVIVVFALLSRQASSGGGIEGIITARHFDAAPETQITVGSGGVHRRQAPGVCSFEVRADRLYTVTVDPTTYAEHAVGDKFYFVRPAPVR